MKRLGLIGALAVCAVASAHATILTIDDVSDTHMDVTVEWDQSGLGLDSSYTLTTSPDPRAYASCDPFRFGGVGAQCNALSITISPPFQPPVFVEVRFFQGTYTFDAAQFAYAGFSSSPTDVLPTADNLGLHFVLDQPQTTASTRSAPNAVPQPSEHLPDNGRSFSLAAVGFGALLIRKTMK